MQTVTNDATPYATSASPAAPSAVHLGTDDGSPQPDAGLLETWRRYVQGWMHHYASEDTWTDEEAEAHLEGLWTIEKMMIDTSATTPAGLMVKLRFALAEDQEDSKARKLFLWGSWNSGHLLNDSQRAVASVIRDLEVMVTEGASPDGHG